MRFHEATVDGITGIVYTEDAIFTIQYSTSLATFELSTHFDSVADVVVIADGLLGRVDASLKWVTGIESTVEGIHTEIVVW